MRSKKINKCIQCGKLFNPFYSRENSKWCSTECYLAHRWGERIVQPCPICGEKCISTGKRNQKYCSQKCYNISKNGKKNPGRSNRKKTICEWCGKEFSRPVSNFHSIREFCSRTCMGAWQSENIKQESHPRWQGGKISGYGQGWKKARHEAIITAKEKCQRCGNEGKQVHHRIPVRFFKQAKYAHHYTNLIVLCWHCHPIVEKEDRKNRPK